ncbi:hypothetical protein N7528_009158 [Penicillium herquei]|nr:hypothetical protein N7528_009158 [Penicillium herquei]
MSMELRSGSWITPRIGVDKWDRLIKPQMMKTKRSSTIATLMMHFRQHAQLEYTKEDLTNLGIEVTYLSNADELLTDEGPFRPHWPFKPGVLKEAMHGKDVACLAVEGIQQFYDDITSRGFGSMGFWFPWRIIETNEKFYGIVDGLGEDIEGSPRHSNPRLTVSAWCERLAPYLEPEVSKSLEVLPPHIHIKSYNQYHDVEELTRYELTAAVTSIYNRLYQKGFGYEKSAND